MVTLDYNGPVPEKKANSSLEPSREQIALFVQTLFAHCGDGGVVSVRTFYEGEDKLFHMQSVSLKRGLPALIEAAVDEARLAANAAEPIVFSPPVAAFRPGWRAREQDLLEAPVLSVEVDKNPRAALAALERVLGPATLVLRSGGVWTNPATGKIEDRLHAHWRLKTPARRIPDAKPPARDAAIVKLKRARQLATAYVDGDATNVPACHPIRWAGSWHKKAQPRLCEIITRTENEIDLDTALAALEAVAPREQSVRRTLDANRDRQAHPLLVAAAVQAIPNPDLDYVPWNRIIMAIFGATGGSDAGREIANAFSRKSSKYNKRWPTTDERWEGIRNSPRDELGFGTLHYEATKADPNWLNRYDAELIADLERAAREARTRGRDGTPKPPPPIVGTAAPPASELPASVEQARGSGEAPPPIIGELNATEEADSASFTAVARSIDLHWHGESRAVNIPWLIKGVLPQTGAGLLSGQWGTGKTFVAIHLAGRVMTGENFIDYRVLRKGGVLFIAKEGKASLPLRLAVMNERSLGRRDNERLPFAWADISLNLLAQGSDPLIKLAHAAQEEMRLLFNLDLALIIVDTMGAAAGFRKEGEGAEGTTGALTKEDRSDTVLALIGERKLTGEIGNLRMGLRKVRDGESGREIPFRLEPIDCGTDEDGDQVTSRIVHWEPGRAANAAPRRRQPRSERMFDDALSAALGAYGKRELVPGLIAVPEDKVREIYIPNYMNEAGRGREAASERWRKARKAAIEAGEVKQERINRVDYLCRAEEEGAL